MSAEQIMLFPPEKATNIDNAKLYSFLATNYDLSRLASRVRTSYGAKKNLLSLRMSGDVKI